MLRRLLKGTELSQILEMVSPAFFDVLPARELWRQGNEIRRRYRDETLYTEVLSRRARQLEEADLGVRIGSLAGAEATAPGDAGERREQGQALLRLYFHQILVGGATLIDIRRERFARRDDGFVWDPGKLSIEWDPSFQEGLREMYEGFYRDDDDARFTAALDELGLRCAEETFRIQFGAGDQRAVRFQVKTFVGTFREAFVACRDAGSSLHRNFVGLGIYLAFLYDHLESLGGGPFDVRAAYLAAAGEPRADAA